MENDVQELVKMSDLGDEAKAFLSSKLGDYLVKAAQADIDEAVHKLKVIDPSSTMEIIRLQALIEHRERFHVWLGDVVVNGESANDALAQIESED